MSHSSRRPARDAFLHAALRWDQLRRLDSSNRPALTDVDADRHGGDEVSSDNDDDEEETTTTTVVFSWDDQHNKPPTLTGYAD